MTNGLCNNCWDQTNRRGVCKSCSREAVLKDGLCSTCYKKDRLQGKCKECGNEGTMTDGYCKTCYDKEHYSGLCSSCGDFGVLIKDYCRTCHDKQDEMAPCKKCDNISVLDHNGICEKCAAGSAKMGICSACGRERSLAFGKMCLECYRDKSEGIQHYMKSSVKKILHRILGKDNFRKSGEEIFLKGEEQPFSPDFELRDLTGKWCPGQYFNSREEWVAQFKDAIQFKEFYQKYLKSKNYIMFTTEHGQPDAIKQYLISRNFLQPNGLPYGKKVTKKPEMSKRDTATE